MTEYKMKKGGEKTINSRAAAFTTMVESCRQPRFSCAEDDSGGGVYGYTLYLHFTPYTAVYSTTQRSISSEKMSLMRETTEALLS